MQPEIPAVQVLMPSEGQGRNACLERGQVQRLLFVSRVEPDVLIAAIDCPARKLPVSGKRDCKCSRKNCPEYEFMHIGWTGLVLSHTVYRRATP